MVKKRRQQCRKHKATGRSWDEYVFGFHDNNGVEIWRCIKCKEANEKWLARYELRKEQERIKFQNWWRELQERNQNTNRKMKEELWDCYLRGKFLHGVKNPDCKDWPILPKDLLQLMRATIRLQRLIVAIKKGEIKTKKQIQEEKRIEIEQKILEQERKLKGVLVNCKKHGHLFMKDVIKGGKSRWTGEQRYKCRQCMSDTKKDYYIRKKEYVLAKHAEYRKNNPEKVKEIKAKSWRKHHGKDKEHATTTSTRTASD